MFLNMRIYTHADINIRPAYYIVGSMTIDEFASRVYLGEGTNSGTYWSARDVVHSDGCDLVNWNTYKLAQ